MNGPGVARFVSADGLKEGKVRNSKRQEMELPDGSNTTEPY